MNSEGKGSPVDSLHPGIPMHTSLFTVFAPTGHLSCFLYTDLTMFTTQNSEIYNVLSNKKNLIYPKFIYHPADKVGMFSTLYII